MKRIAFQVRLSGRGLSVQRRLRVTPLVFVIAALLLAFCLKVAIGALPSLTAAYRAKDAGQLVGGAVAIILPVVIMLCVLSIKSGEILHCGPLRIHTARRSFWFRWKRERFTAGAVRNMRYVKLRQTKGGPVFGLKFDVEARSVTIFQHITPSQAEEVLQGCRTLGIQS